MLSCVLRTTEKADSVDQWNAVGVGEEAWILCEDEDPGSDPGFGQIADWGVRTGR